MKKLKQLQRFLLREWYKLAYHTPYYESVYGRFKVMYKDGRISRPMCYKNAKAYAGIFEGEVIDNF